MAGQGIRFKNAGYINPKPLIIVENKPIIQHVIEMFPPMKTTFICNDIMLNNTNLREVLLSIRPESTIITIPTHKNGPVYSLSLIKEYIDEDSDIIVSYCDFSSLFNYNDFISLIKNDNADGIPDGIIISYKGFHPHMLGTDNYAFIKCDENNNFLEIQEKKPYTDNRMNEYASNGIYYFKKGLLNYYVDLLIKQGIRVNGEFYVSLLYNLLKQDNKNVQIFEIEYMLQWGTPKDLEEYLYWSNYFSVITTPQQQVILDNTVLILPMAGRGSRFEMTGKYTKAKPLLDVCDKPMIIQAVKQIPKCNKNVFICLNEHYSIIKDELLNYDNNSIIYPINDVTEGQACTCKIGINNLLNTDPAFNKDIPVLISACDNGIEYNVSKFNNLLNESDTDIIVFTFKDHSSAKYWPHMYSWVLNDENGFVKKVFVKERSEGCEECIIGTMLFRKCRYFLDGYEQIILKNIKTNNEYYVDNILNECILSGLKIKSFCVNTYVCWGTPNDYETYLYWQRYFDKTNKHNYSIKLDRNSQ
jgi:NDP-sugar pyrophosphorylase family protein